MHNSILIATCDKEVQELIVKILTRYEFHLLCVEESSSAIISVLDEDFDFAIIDFALKGLSGQKIIALIQKMRPKIPVIFLSERKNHDHLLSPNVKMNVCKPLNQIKIENIRKKVLSDLG